MISWLLLSFGVLVPELGVHPNEDDQNFVKTIAVLAKEDLLADSVKVLTEELIQH